MARKIVLILLLCSAAAWAKDRTARLYNLTTGEVTNMYCHGRYKGTIALTLNGESLRGEYSTVSSGSVSWGSVFSGATTANGYAASVPLSQRGSAVATGKGTILNCEFIAERSGGNGACEDNHGIKYKLMF